MREFVLRLVKRAIPVAIILAIIGYLMAEVYLTLVPQSGVEADPENNKVRWTAPTRLALFGVILLVILESLNFAIRRKKPPEVPDLADKSSQKSVE